MSTPLAGRATSARTGLCSGSAPSAAREVLPGSAPSVRCTRDLQTAHAVSREESQTSCTCGQIVYAAGPLPRPSHPPHHAMHSPPAVRVVAVVVRAWIVAARVKVAVRPAAARQRVVVVRLPAVVGQGRVVVRLAVVVGQRGVVRVAVPLRGRAVRRACGRLGRARAPRQIGRAARFRRARAAKIRRTRASTVWRARAGATAPGL